MHWKVNDTRRFNEDKAVVKVAKLALKCPRGGLKPTGRPIDPKHINFCLRCGSRMREIE